MAYYGVDLHSDNFTVCCLEADSQAEYCKFELTSADISRFLEMLCEEDAVAVESTGNASWFCDHLRDCGCRIVVVNSRRFDLTRRVGKKTDRNDSHALAWYLMKDMLPSVRLKTRVQDDILVLVRSRELLVKQRTALINSIHGLYVRMGVRIAKDKLKRKKHLEGIDLTGLSPARKHTVIVFGEQIIVLNQLIMELERLVVEEASGLPGFDGLVSIKGIGPYSAAIILSTIGDIGDFDGPDKLASYFGIVPRIYRSNESSVSGRIHKAGNKTARTVLVQCTWVSIRYSDHLKEHFERICRNSGSRQKAIVATARKLLRIIYYTLRKGWVFEDFATFKLKQDG